MNKISEEAKTIYFNESGYTGSDLMNDNMPYFTCVVAPEIINHSVIDIFYQIYVRVLFEITNNSFNNKPLVDENVTKILNYLIFACRYTANYRNLNTKF